MELEKTIKIYNELKKYKEIIGSIDTDFFFNFVETILQALEDKNTIIIEMKKILNQWMPLAECTYWNYENHTCSYTCGGCEFLSKNNRRTDSSVLIDDDRYCRLYENGGAEEDTVFVKIEDLILRHGTKKSQKLLEDKNEG